MEAMSTFFSHTFALIPCDKDRMQMESDEDVLVEYLDELEEFSVNVKSKSGRVGDLFFAETIQNYGPVLLNKKQTPRVKALKKQALKEVIDYILIQNGSILSEDQVYKKLNNMKARVKAKRSNNAKLNEGELLLSQLMTSEEAKCSTVYDEKYGRGYDGSSAAVDFEPQVPETFRTTSKSQDTKTTEIGIGDETHSDDEDVLQPKSKHAKLSHPGRSSEFVMASVSVERKFDKRDQCKHQIDSTSPNRSTLQIAELEKMVLLKKLDLLDLQKSFYEKAHNVLDLWGNTLCQNK